jgi:hypothetical protein
MWQTVLLAVDFGSISRTWYLLPLIIIVSLVYSASRYEEPWKIIRRAGRLSAQIAGFMAVVLALLAFLAMGL